MNFLGRLFRTLWRGLDGLRKVLHLLVLLFILAIVIAATHKPLPLVPAKAALVVHLQGRLVEQLTGSPFDRSLGALSADHEPETLVRDVVDSVRAAAKDDRIRVLVLDTEDLGGGGLTKLQAIADALQAFRKSGKRVLAFSRFVSQEQYYLMAQADAAYVDPAGALGVMGFAAYHLYFHEALERLGVEVNVFKVGTHKSFTEPYTRQDMSPEDREQTVAWMTPLWDAYQTGVERGRGLPAGSVAAYLRDAVPALRAAGGDGALLAEQRHLVTGRKTWLAFEREVIGLVGEDRESHSFNAIDDAAYLQAVHVEPSLSKYRGSRVAVLVASGNIMPGDRPPGEIGADSFADLLRKTRYDKDVKAVVLRIDSGGGSLLASEIIRQEVAALREAGKPVVASFSSVAASGGYYIAMDANEIWAEPTTITGSIGVFGIVPTFEKTLGKLGVASDGVATSPLAGAMHVERAFTAETREVLQLGVEHAYHDFVARVAVARHRTPEEIEPLAEGRVYTGEAAAKLGLIDHLGVVDDAIKAAAGLAKLEPGKYGVSWREKDLSWRDTLVRQMRAESQAYLARLGLESVLGVTPPPALRQALGDADRQLRAIGSLNDPRGLYYYCGCEPL